MRDELIESVNQIIIRGQFVKKVTSISRNWSKKDRIKLRLR